MATTRVFPREIDGHWYKIEIYYDAEGRRRQRSLGGISEAEAQMLKANPPPPEPGEKHQEVQVEGEPDSELEIPNDPIREKVLAQLPQTTEDALALLSRGSSAMLKGLLALTQLHPEHGPQLFTAVGMLNDANSTVRDVFPETERV